MKATRRLRRWRRETPARELALTLVGVGCVLVLLAAFVAGVTTHWL